MNWSDMNHRERDALVAEKVMGWNRYAAVSRGKRVVVIAENYKDCWHIYSRSQGDPGTWEATDDPLTETRHLKRYTTDISAAWEVVEKMREDGRPPAITHYVGIWHVRFYEGGFETIYSEAEADTAPEAIALAALRAKGVEV